MDKNVQIALFKYKIIAPILADDRIRQNQKAYFRKLSEKVHNIPFLGEKKFSASTFKKWLVIYRKNGFEGLLNSRRKDKGSSRAISGELMIQISHLTEKYRFRTVVNLYDYLIMQGIISVDQFSYVTLNNFVKKNDLFKPHIQKKPRKAYEVGHINQLWVADFMYGPYVMCGKRKVKSYLCAIIDDFSRYIVSAKFSTSLSSLSFQFTLKKAISTFGVPNNVYCDNGKAFVEGSLSLISARLGFVIIHSKPYDAPSRGKIERYFKTVRDRFIPNLYIQLDNATPTLVQLNSFFSNWLLNDYNKKIHSAINSSPYDRYFADIHNTKLRKIPVDKVHKAFFITVFRRVNNDSTIPFEKDLFQVPSEYIGMKIQIRFDPEKKDELFLFEGEKQITKLNKLDKHLNAQFPIPFLKEEKDNV